MDAQTPTTQQIHAMVYNAREKALAGCSMHAQMLMNLLKVEGGREVLWAATNAAQRKIIKDTAKNWRPPPAVAS